MTPIPLDIAGGIVIGGAIFGGLPGVTLAAVAVFAGELFPAQANIPDAGKELAAELRCFLPPCGDSSGVDQIIGHSFGGGIAAEIGRHLVGASGQRVRRLMTIDTPYDVLGLVTMEEQAEGAGVYFENHVNYYSPCFFPGGAVGSPLATVAGSNTRNYNAGAGDRVTSRCEFGVIQHICLAHTFCGLLASSDPEARALLNGGLLPGDYMEGATPNSVVAGNENPNCEPIDDIIWDDPTVLAEPELPDRQGVTFADPVYEFHPPSGQASAFAGGSVFWIGCAGYLMFEYQLDGVAPDQDATAHWNGQLIWRRSTPTDAGAWVRKILYISGGNVGSGSLLFQLAPPDSGIANPAAVLRIRNVQLIHCGVRQCTAAPIVAHQPSTVLTPPGRTVAFGAAPEWPYGVTYQWTKDGAPLTDGVRPSGASIIAAVGPILVIQNVTGAEIGDYRCVLTNDCGSTESVAARLEFLGDTNGDCVVDLADLSRLLSHFGELSGGTLSGGDFDNNDVVDISDLSVLLASFGRTCP